MEVEELLRRYAAGERDFSWIEELFGELIEVDLSGINLTEFEFDVNPICCCNFTRANLSGANLSELTLDETNFSFTNLREVSMAQSSLQGANLTGADLTGADLGGAYFWDANLTDAKLINTYIECSLDGANLTRADLTGAKGWESASFEDCIFYETIMPDGSMRTNNS